jgi:hypothetical protein
MHKMTLFVIVFYGIRGNGDFGLKSGLTPENDPMRAIYTYVSQKIDIKRTKGFFEKMAFFGHMAKMAYFGHFHRFYRFYRFLLFLRVFGVFWGSLGS